MFKSMSAIVLGLSLSLLGQARAAVPALPALQNPGVDAVLQPVNFTASWLAAAGAASYHVQVSTTLDFAARIVDDSGFTETFRPIGPLKNNLAYYWRVRARNADGLGGYSDPRKFTTIVAIPVAVAQDAPAANAVNQALKPVLLWRKQAETVSYHVQVSAKADFSTFVFEDNVTDTTATPGPLATSTAYFWRVNGKNEAGIGPYSAVRTFTTVPAMPAVPALIGPADNAEQLAIPVAFSWHKADRAVTYQLQVSAFANFLNPVYDHVFIAGDTAFTDAKLDYGTKYYWRVRSGNPGEAAPFTDARSFTTLAVPAVPTYVKPADVAVDQPVFLTLTWRKSALTAAYKVQVSTNAAFTGALAVNDSVLTDTSKPIGPLDNKTVYYWRVRSKNAAGVSDYAAVRKFTTIILIAPIAPALASPGDAETGISPSLVLKWHPSDRAAIYHLQVSLTSTFATLVSEDAADKDTTKSVGPLHNDETYYWRVSAKNDAGASAYSEIRSFTTRAGAAAEPVLVSPADNAVNQPQTLTLVWKKSQNAETYHIQVSVKADFSTRLVDDSGGTDTTLQAGPLVYEQIYYWRVAAKNSAGASAYSDARKFTVIIGAPAIPSLLEPADNAAYRARSFTFKWDASSRAASYRLQLSTTATFSSSVLDDSSLTDTTRAVSDLAANTLYFWRVRAKNAGGVGGWSDIRSFKTEPAVGIARQDAKDREGFTVLSGSRATRGAELEFSVKHEGNVRFTVINPVNGRSSELVNKHLDAGSYRLPIGPQGRGVYFLNMTAGDFRQTRKVFLP